MDKQLELQKIARLKSDGYEGFTLPYKKGFIPEGFFLDGGILHRVISARDETDWEAQKLFQQVKI